MVGKQRFLALALLGTLMAAPASANTVDVYTIGSNPAGSALDPIGGILGGIPSITWNHNLVYGGPGPVLLQILAEGIDDGEHDAVFFNGTYIGDLTQQSFYSPLFNLQPGAGALAGITAQILSIFDVTSLFISGLNTVRIDVDPNNWVNEIEVSSLNPVPIPAALPLFAAALSAMGFFGWRKKRKTTLAA